MDSELESLDKIRRMSLEEIHSYIFSSGELSGNEKDAIRDRLGNLCWEIGQLWDKVEGTDPHRGSSHYGTPNHRSMTYKLRKVAKFSYP